MSVYGTGPNYRSAPTRMRHLRRASRVSDWLIARRWLLVGLLIVLAITKSDNATAYTAELCSGVVLRTTPIYDTPSYGSGMAHPNDMGLMARAGTKVDGIVSLVVDTSTGLRRYCDLRGGACYPIDAIRLLNCSVSNKATRDGSILQYETILNRPATDQRALRMSDVEETLMSRFGLCHACAGNAAYHYVKEPNSTCGQLVRGALEGDPVATKRLQAAEYCWQ
jgi:hypothetical protein